VAIARVVGPKNFRQVARIIRYRKGRDEHGKRWRQEIQIDVDDIDALWAAVADSC
jgi:hypothetical protein